MIKHPPIFIQVLFLLFSFTAVAQTANTGNFSIKTVVIDAGHGGKDPGAVGHNKIQEKDVALSIALKTGKYIEEFVPGVKVIYTRSTDKFLELYERAKVANNAKADLFISIHANAAPKKSATAVGTETFILGTHRNNSNLEVAKRENSVILMEDDYESSYEGYDPNKPESDIIFSLMQSAHVNESLHFASLVEDQFTSRAKRKSRGVKQAGFMVLYKTTMPSVLIELGFLTNPDEAKFLATESGQNNMASGIYRAFKSYKEAMEGQEQGASGSSPSGSSLDESLQYSISEAYTKPEEVPSPLIVKSPNTEQQGRTEVKPVVVKQVSTNTAITSSHSGGYFRIELYDSRNSHKVSKADLDRVGEISVEINRSQGLKRFMLLGQYQAESEAQQVLSEAISKGFRTARLIWYENGRRIAK